MVNWIHNDLDLMDQSQMATEDSSSTANTGGPTSVVAGEVGVPFGWKRELINGQIAYISPSNYVLCSIQEVQAYLQTEGTCKCGLECPLFLDNLFKFDPSLTSRPYSVDESLRDGLGRTKLCNHRRKNIALATFHQHHQNSTMLAEAQSQQFIQQRLQQQQELQQEHQQPEEYLHQTHQEIHHQNQIQMEHQQPQQVIYQSACDLTTATGASEELIDAGMPLHSLQSGLSNGEAVFHNHSHMSNNQHQLRQQQPSIHQSFTGNTVNVLNGMSMMNGAPTGVTFTNAGSTATGQLSCENITFSMNHLSPNTAAMSAVNQNYHHNHHQAISPLSCDTLGNQQAFESNQIQLVHANANMVPSPISIPGMTTMASAGQLAELGITQQILRANQAGEDGLHLINPVQFSSVAPNTFTVLHARNNGAEATNTILIPHIIPSPDHQQHHHQQIMLGPTQNILPQMSHQVAHQMATAAGFTTIPASAIQQPFAMAAASQPYSSYQLSSLLKKSRTGRARKGKTKARKSRHPPTVAAILRKAEEDEEKRLRELRQSQESGAINLIENNNSVVVNCNNVGSGDDDRLPVDELVYGR